MVFSRISRISRWSNPESEEPRSEYATENPILFTVRITYRHTSYCAAVIEIAQGTRSEMVIQQFGAKTPD
jgi:hypothetical protein